MEPTTKNGNSKKGFASMDVAKQREIASKGGRASAKGDTSRRGFASMDKNKQREISSQGGRSQGHSRQLRKEANAQQAAGTPAPVANDQNVKNEEE